MASQSHSTASSQPLPIIGWREWLTLPDLGIPHIKVKVDTGARSSALHAFDIHRFEQNGTAMVRFRVHPHQRDSTVTMTAEAPLWDQRLVRSSSGHSQPRPVIRTAARLGEHLWPIELTLTNRDAMGFRMLLGREAMRHRFWVDPGRSYLLGSAPETSVDADDLDESEQP
jgi:hypothetical protein